MEKITDLNYEKIVWNLVAVMEGLLQDRKYQDRLLVEYERRITILETQIDLLIRNNI